MGHCSCRFHMGFSAVVDLYSYMVEYAFVQSVELNKKFVVAENFAELVSKGKRFCLFPKVSDPVFPGGWGI